LVALPVANFGSEAPVKDAVAWNIDKSVLTLSEPRRYSAHHPNDAQEMENTTFLQSNAAQAWSSLAVRPTLLS
jgi:hypothetical protein